MTDESEQTRRFVAALKQLLSDWNVVLSAKDHYEGYAEAGEDVRITAEFERFDVDLGRYFDGKP